MAKAAYHSQEQQTNLFGDSLVFFFFLISQLLKQHDNTVRATKKGCPRLRTDRKKIEENKIYHPPPIPTPLMMTVPFYVASMQNNTRRPWASSSAITCKRKVLGTATFFFFATRTQVLSFEGKRHPRRLVVAVLLVFAVREKQEHRKSRDAHPRGCCAGT